MAKDIKMRMQKMIDREKVKLQTEIEMYQHKLHDTMMDYGCGGAYSRQEAAIEKRERQLDELQDFSRQLSHYVKLKEVGVYVFGCRQCGCTWFTTTEPFDDWHECPTCRSMIHISNPKRQYIRIEDQGESWQHMLNEAINRDKENGE